MHVEPFFDQRTSTLTYIVWDSASRAAVVIDPVLDYDPATSSCWTESLERLVSLIEAEQLTLHFILETHAHADHISGAQVLKGKFPRARVAIGKNITEVQRLFKVVYDLPHDFPTDGRQFDLLLDDRQLLNAGSLTVEVVLTPGHTPACTTYKIGQAVFVGDALFLPDSGTGRCDFPGASAIDLYHSVTQRLYTLPDATRVYVGHDYQPGGREVRWMSTMGEQKKANLHLRADTTQDEFVQFREQRDATLSAPKLLWQSVQINIDAGSLPTANASQNRFLKIPFSIANSMGNA